MSQRERERERSASEVALKRNMATTMAAPAETSSRSRGASTSHGMFSRLNLTVECPTEFGQTVHVSGSSFLAGVSNPALVSVVALGFPAAPN